MSSGSSSTTKLSDIIHEYGQAFRDDWNDIDGRAVQSDMEAIAAYLEEGMTVLSEKEAADLRAYLGLCLLGKGHWNSWCWDEGCNES